MLKLIGKVVTWHEFESMKTGKRYAQIGVAAEGEYNQVSGELHQFEGVTEGDEVELKVSISNNGKLWLARF